VLRGLCGLRAEHKHAVRIRLIQDSGSVTDGLGREPGNADHRERGRPLHDLGHKSCPFGLSVLSGSGLACLVDYRQQFGRAALEPGQQLPQFARSHGDRLVVLGE
jgi:hypothetical protein